MKKALIYGASLGAGVGLINALISLSGVPILGILFGVIVLAGYLTLLVLIIRDKAQENAPYGKRFLAGWVYSLMFGLLDGLIGTIYLSATVGGMRQQLIDAYQAYGVNANVDTLLPLLPVFSFIGAILFNAVAGAFWSAIVAAVVQPNQDAPVTAADVAKTDTQPAVEAQVKEQVKEAKEEKKQEDEK